MRRFFFGGSRYFLRFLRLMLLTLALLAFFSWVLFGLPWEKLVLEPAGVIGGDLETLRSESDAVRLSWQQSGAQLLIFALVLTWATYARTRLAMHETRSAIVAGASTFFTMLLHPIKTLRPMFLLSLCEVFVLLLCGWLTGIVQGGLDSESGTWRILLLFALGLVALVWGKIVRGARYCAAVQVSRDVVTPLSRPDPWSQRIGGPGGPQYPIDDSDEYGVSL